MSRSLIVRVASLCSAASFPYIHRWQSLLFDFLLWRCAPCWLRLSILNLGRRLTGRGVRAKSRPFARGGQPTAAARGDRTCTHAHSSLSRPPSWCTDADSPHAPPAAAAASRRLAQPSAVQFLASLPLSVCRDERAHSVQDSHPEGHQALQRTAVDQGELRRHQAAIPAPGKPDSQQADKPKEAAQEQRDERHTHAR